MRFPVAFVFAATLAVACSNVMHEDLHGDVSEARAELSRHHELVMTAPSLDAVVADVPPHKRSMDAFMKRVGEDMKHCSQVGAAAMHNSMADANRESDAHEEALLEARDLGTAREKCEEYVENMRHLLSAIDASLLDMGCM